MSRRSEALAVVGPYREEPEDMEAYRGPAELSMCAWCEFGGLGCGHPRMQTKGNAGYSIRSNIANPCGCERWEAAANGECPGYRPSLFTLLLRLVGLRKPVMR